MTRHQIDSNALRAELRALPRGTVLLVAERAIELVSFDYMGALLADIVQMNVEPTDARSDNPATVVGTSLLEEARSTRLPWKGNSTRKLKKTGMADAHSREARICLSRSLTG
jgi:hypothetical protein